MEAPAGRVGHIRLSKARVLRSFFFVPPYAHGCDLSCTITILYCRFMIGHSLRRINISYFLTTCPFIRGSSSLHRCVLPYKDRNRFEILVQLMKLTENGGSGPTATFPVIVRSFLIKIALHIGNVVKTDECVRTNRALWIRSNSHKDV